MAKETKSRKTRIKELIRKGYDDSAIKAIVFTNADFIKVCRKEIENGFY